ncbi:tubulin-tyrosine ligase-like protein [Phanerochaete sordida]|uniref:Tubulin-tyrosine ligase-like protein n=1 Tax=Phanerochaete sordida TaxID=48140 RepID=A0A9P3LK30_9APHY|nr:tubulin-tyrosine ligase-like protein [Phanerochaete sordida]
MAARPSVALVAWPSAPLTNRLVRNALDTCGLDVDVVAAQLPASVAGRDVLQWASYDAMDHELTLAHPPSARVLTSAYTIRKALIRKHFLARTALRHCTKHPDSPLRAGVPRTWEVELQFADELDEMWTDELWDLGAELERGDRWMILKPGMADRGNGLRLFHTKEELENIFLEFEDADDDEDEDAPAAEDDESGTGVATSQLRHFVVQEYLSNPLLIDPAQIPLDGSPLKPSLPDAKGHKFHLRAYCIASGALRVFLYDRILALFASAPYTAPSPSSSGAAIDLAPHLTNTCLQAHTGEAYVRLLDELVGAAVLSEPGAGIVTREDLDDIRDQAALLLGETFAAALGMSVHFQPLPNAFELFGVDLLVTHAPAPTPARRFRVSLLEANAEPAIEMTGPRLTWVLEDLFCAIARVCVVPFFRGGEGAGAGGAEGAAEGESSAEGSSDDAGGRKKWKVGETREHLRMCLDTEVRGAGGW